MVVLAAVGDVLRTEFRPLRRPPKRPAGGDGLLVVVAEAVLVAVGWPPAARTSLSATCLFWRMLEGAHQKSTCSQARVKLVSGCVHAHRVGCLCVPFHLQSTVLSIREVDRSRLDMITDL